MNTRGAHYLWSKAEGSWDARSICAWHASTDLLAELSYVTTGSVQILQQHTKRLLILLCLYEGPQTPHLYCHTVQSTLGKLNRHMKMC